MKPTSTQPIAFFSAEYAIEDSLPVYAGGLGVLSGDMVLEAGDQDFPLVGFGLLYRYGFITDSTKPSRQLDPKASGYQLITENDQAVTVDVEFSDGSVTVQAWEKYYGGARVILLDSDHPSNTPEERAIVSHLYEADIITKIREEWILGIASVKFLRHLGLDPMIYHLNEGHTAFVIAGRLLDYRQHHPEVAPEKALEIIKENQVATKHTVLAGSGILVERQQLQSLVAAPLERYGIPFDLFFQCGQWHTDPTRFSANKLLITQTVRQSGVSQIHVQQERADHPEGKLITITNGVHLPRWLARNLAEGDFAELSDQELRQRHLDNKRQLIEVVNEATGSRLAVEPLTVVWARRIAFYKRPELLFNDLSRLSELANAAERPIQFVVAGNPNPNDHLALEMLQRILGHTQRPELKDKVVYLPGYSLPTTQRLAAGADVWLNTPIRGQEACGTSGMKASLNGALQLSVSDGWVDEVEPDQIGWILPEDDTETALYDLLQEIAALYYDREPSGISIGWLAKMRLVMKLTRTQFSAARMLSDYSEKLYKTS